MQTNIENTIHRQDTDEDVIDNTAGEDRDEDPDDTNEVYIMNPKHEDRASSFFAQPGVLAGKLFIFFIIVDDASRQKEIITE